MKTLLFLSSFLMVSLLRAQVTLTLQVSQDAVIGYDDGSSTNPAGNNYGSNTDNAAFCVPGISTNGLNVNRSLIEFSFSQIPANAVITSASLNLYACPVGNLSGHTGNANSCTLQRILQTWGEYTVTWNSQPSSTPINQVVLPQSTSSTENYLNINVLTLVQDMFSNASTSFGFKMQLVTEAVSNALTFGSKDNTNPNLRPTLVVTYNTSMPVDGIAVNTLQESHIGAVYPNPGNNGEFNMSNLTGVTKIGLYDGQGRKVKAYDLSELQGPEIKVTGLEPGIYFCDFMTDQNFRSVSKVLVR